MTLPPELGLDHLLSLPLPDDVTLAECKAHFEMITEARMLRSLSRVVRFRFCYAEDPPRDCPDDMLLHVFRTLATNKQAVIIIDDGGGVRPLVEIR